MEIEGRSQVVAKKVWNIVRILFFMLRKGIAKSKLMAELHLMLKRGKLAGKAFVENLILNHYHASFTCRSHPNTFISPGDYEFSCSNSPVIKRHKNNHRFYKSKQYDNVSTLTAVQKVLEMLNNEKVLETNSSPFVSFPGFGKSPIGRQLRVTDSPFPLKDEQGDSHIDVAAQEFINNFYKELNLQNRIAALHSPCHNSWVR